MPAKFGAIEFSIRVALHLKKEGRWVIASAPALDVHSQGRTDEEAINNLSEAIRLFIGSCYERGTLDQVLKDCGFHSSHEKERLGLSAQGPVLDVPVHLLSNRNAEAQAC
jgi:predicted RNase H-like HicB family nuclease